MKIGIRSIIDGVDLAVFAAVVAAFAAQGAASTTVTYTYDANGNMTGRTDGASTDTFTYDYENRLIAADIRIGLNPAGQISYRYDADGLRTSKALSGTTTDYLVDKNRDYAQVLVEEDGATTASYVYGADLLSMTRPGAGSRSYHYDGQHSTRLLTDPDGDVTDTFAYEAYGVSIARTGSTPNSNLFMGELFDEALGLYYMRARYHNPTIGRFVSRDPHPGDLAVPLSLHRYAYASNDPINRADPSGLFSLSYASAGDLPNLGCFGFPITLTGPTSSTPNLDSRLTLAQKAAYSKIVRYVGGGMPDFVTWFGEGDPERSSRVARRYNRMSDFLSRPVIWQAESVCEYYGEVRVEEREPIIHICTFRVEPLKDEQLEFLIVHETQHKANPGETLGRWPSGGRRGRPREWYGRCSALNRARTQPDLAELNPDNYAYAIGLNTPPDPDNEDDPTCRPGGY